MSTRARQSHAEIVARIKDEVLDDVINGVVPGGIADFGDLHDHVDAHTYGGLCDENADVDLEETVAIQEDVHQWLQGGALARATTITFVALVDAIRAALPRLGEDGTSAAGAVAFLEDPGGWIDQLGLMGEEDGEVTDLDHAVAARAIEFIRNEWAPVGDR